MSWFKTTAHSLLGLLGSQLGPGDSVLETGKEDIREAMLGLLEEIGAQSADVTRRIRYAADIEALWFLRAGLMHSLAAVYGEAQANWKVREISDMFEGLLRGSYCSRPSPLMG